MLRSPLLRTQLARPTPSTVAAFQLASGIFGTGAAERDVDVQLQQLQSKVPELQGPIVVSRAFAKAQDGQLDDAVKLCNSVTCTRSKRAAKALEFRCRTAQLHEERSKGPAAEETIVANAMEAAEKALEELIVLDPSWATYLAAGELFLLNKETKEAQSHFGNAISLLQGKVTPSKASVAATVAYHARNAASIKAISHNYKNTNVAKLVQLSDEDLKESLSALKASEKAFAALSAAELVVSAKVSAHLEANHHYFDFFMTSEYEPWTTPFTLPLAARIRAFLKPEEAFIMGGSGLKCALEKISKPNIAFNQGEDVLNAALNSADVLGSLRASRRNSGAITKSDETYAAVHSDVEGFIQSHLVRSETDLTTLSVDGIEQLKYRALVGQAVAAEQMGDMKGSKAILDDVIQSNRYCDMWKALLARGRVHREMGLIDDAEGDFKILHSLKKAVDGFDIPLLDENRYRSAF